MNSDHNDQRRTVLVVDDEPSICLLVSEILGDCDLRVLTAGDGSAALNVLERESDRIELAILDYSMPGMDCQTLIRKMRELNANIKLIISSGAPSAMDAVSSVDGMIPKPYSMHQLSELVVSLITLPRANGTIE